MRPLPRPHHRLREHSRPREHWRAARSAPELAALHQAALRADHAHLLREPT